MDRCKSCGAAIRWVVMPGGKSMPIDHEPHPEGNVIVHSDGRKAGVPSQDELAKIAEELGPDGMANLARFRHRSHFATCPHHAKWRKKQ